MKVNEQSVNKNICLQRYSVVRFCREGKSLLWD